MRCKYKRLPAVKQGVAYGFLIVVGKGLLALVEGPFAGEGVDLVRWGGILVWLVFVVSLYPVIAADNSLLFVEKCGACHKRGSAVAPINPADKAGLVWMKYFQRKRHPVELEPKISEGEMIMILDYLKGHGADSEVPVAAAIPE